MSTASRELVLKRRAAALDDFSAHTASTGTLTISQALGSNVLTYNAKMVVGIATETDVGLDPLRHPYICVLSPGGVDSKPTDLVVHYWPVIDANGNYVPFQRRNEDVDRFTAKMYGLFPDFDEMAWEIYHAVVDANPDVAFSHVDIIEHRHDSFIAQIPLSDTLPAAAAKATEDIKALMEHYRVNKLLPYIKIGQNRYMLLAPHGSVRNPAALGNLPDESVPAYEYFMTKSINYKILEERYPAAPKGMVNQAASAIAYAHRYGLYESAANREWNVIEASFQDNEHFMVNKVHHPSDVAPPTWLADSTLQDMSSLKYDAKTAEIAGGACVMAGFQHYLFNHTTGGSRLNGPLLGTLMMYKLYDPTAVLFTEEQQTSLYYDALHPVNKRLVANLAIRNSKVMTAGRNRINLPFEELRMDTYVNLRSSIYPAGSHKAYLTLLVLMRICDANLGVFLPWNSELTSVVNTCKMILSGGARAHVGSSYYTGMPPIVQSGSLDAYLPDLAYYIQTLAKGDTLALSPHLGPNIAASAGTSWKNLINKLKSDDLSTADPAVVMKFLHATGHIRFAFDPADESTWGPAAQASADASRAIKDALGS